MIDAPTTLYIKFKTEDGCTQRLLQCMDALSFVLSYVLGARTTTYGIS
jgi:uncharacterized protein (DUF1919 family)